MRAQAKNVRIAVILAGGSGRRMGGADKGGLLLKGRRLFDFVRERLAPQVEVILISGRDDYGSGCPVVGDLETGPRGPAAGLWAALLWMEKNAPEARGFLTAPVDGPFLPGDLFDRLATQDASAVAANRDGVHPTFAYWRCDALKAALESAPSKFGIPLKELAERVHAKHIVFDGVDAFDNINTPQDLKRVEERLRS